ncbi:MAG: hypothetical protein PHO00_01010 [bacterium]|nr:hypothetical protein [bacterium]
MVFVEGLFGSGKARYRELAKENRKELFKSVREIKKTQRAAKGGCVRWLKIKINRIQQ